MTALEILKAARALISDPAKWTQEATARLADGSPTGALVQEAESFCAIGAISRIAGPEGTFSAVGEDAYRTLRSRVGKVSEFNDSHTHAEVLAAFDKAISDLEAK